MLALSACRPHPEPSLSIISESVFSFSGKCWGKLLPRHVLNIHGSNGGLGKIHLEKTYPLLGPRSPEIWFFLVLSLSAEVGSERDKL